MKIVKISALWCPACLITNNNLNKLLEKYKDIEVVILTMIMMILVNIM